MSITTHRLSVTCLPKSSVGVSCSSHPGSTACTSESASRASSVLLNGFLCRLAVSRHSVLFRRETGSIRFTVYLVHLLLDNAIEIEGILPKYEGNDDLFQILLYLRLTLKKNERYETERENVRIDFSTPPSARSSVDCSYMKNQRRSYMSEIKMPTTSTLKVHFLIRSVLLSMYIAAVHTVKFTKSVRKKSTKHVSTDWM